jgi:hypothetical protein
MFLIGLTKTNESLSSTPPKVLEPCCSVTCDRKTYSVSCKTELYQQIA